MDCVVTRMDSAEVMQPLRFSRQQHITTHSDHLHARQSCKEMAAGFFSLNSTGFTHSTPGAKKSSTSMVNFFMPNPSLSESKWTDKYFQILTLFVVVVVVRALQI